MCEVVEHTADIGLRVRAEDLNGLFAEAGRGLFSLILDNLDEVRPQTSLDVTLTARPLEDLFFDWLTELLHTFEVRRLVLCSFQVTVNGTRLAAAVAGEPIDPARHRLLREIKAITYHGLSVRRSEQGWMAEVIVDI